MEPRYGTAGDRWLIQPGEIWRIGPHVLACGDLEQDQGIELLERYGPAALLLADPPYDQAQATRYRRKIGDQQEVSFPALMGKILDLAQEAMRGCLETGRGSEKMLAQLAHQEGATVEDTWDITYGGASPCKLLHISWHHHPRLLLSSPMGLDELAAYAWCIEQFTDPSDLIFDPCIGQGMVAKAAVQTGRRILGMELNPRRLAVTLDWLSKTLKVHPRNVAHLEARSG